MASQLPPGAIASPVAPVYVGGMPLTDVVGTLGLNQVAGTSKQTSDNQFWSTPERAATDTTREIFEVSLNGIKKVNAVAFDLPRFPHKAYLLYNNSAGDWVPALNAAGRPVIISIVDSLPALILPYSHVGTTDAHPQHYGAGHWLHYEQTINPVEASQFRLVLLRQATPGVPFGVGKRPIPYSLGVRGFNVGYKIAGRSDVPLSNRTADIVTESDSFASAIDVLGSPVEFSLRENRASDLLNGAIWKCEPQPVTNAVVNLYVDARDAMGQGRVIDRFFIDPITSGVHLNLYYSNVDPDQSDFGASDDPMTFPKAIASGVITPTADGLLFPDDPAFIDVDNSVIQWDTSQPYWVGLVLQPQFGSDDTDRHIFFDTGTVRFEWTGSAFQVSVGQNTSILRDGIDFDTNERLGFAIFFDGQTTHLYAQDDGEFVDYSVDTPAASSAVTNAKVRLGGLVVPQGGDPLHGDFRLVSFIVKPQMPPGTAEFEHFFDDPSAYVVKPQFSVDDIGDSDGAILRYDVFYQTFGLSSLNPYGLVGGAGDVYSQVVWTPINRDFKMTKGFLVFNQVKAKYFKFEFTNLAAQPYDAPKVTSVKINTFPTAAYYSKASTKESGNNAGGGATAQIDAAGAAALYADQVRLTKSGPSEATYTPTEALFSPDPNVAARLRNVSPYYSLQDWHVGWNPPRFVNVTKHTYQQTEVAFTNRIAFFVALNSLQMFRLDYAPDDDTDQYHELFLDGFHLQQDPDGGLGGWSLGDGSMSTPNDLTVPVSVTSRVFNSRRSVSALQFATVQSPAVQLLSDPDFNDPSLQYWESVGDAVIKSNNDFLSDIGTLVHVSRLPVDNFWATLEDRYATWDDVEQSDPDPDKPVWDDLQESHTVVPIGGIRTKEKVSSSLSGRLYAAGRVYATHALQAPLYIQIIDQNENVLAQESINVDAGRLVEWYVAYTLGEGGDTVLYTWDDIESGPALSPDGDPLHPNYNEMEALGAWDQLDSTTSPLIGDVRAQMVQLAPSDDDWYVDNISVFDDSIVWEVSNDGGTTFYPVYDIRNDPHGVFMFPDDEVTSPTQGYGLQWRVTGNKPGQQVSSVAVRPWYDAEVKAAQPYRETIQAGGPNTAPADHYGPIVHDPRFRLWHSAIPESWWWMQRQLLLHQHPVTPVKKPIILPASLYPIDEGSPPPPPPSSIFLTDDDLVVD